MEAMECSCDEGAEGSSKDSAALHMAGSSSGLQGPHDASLGPV